MRWPEPPEPSPEYPFEEKHWSYWKRPPWLELDWPSLERIVARPIDDKARRDIEEHVNLFVAHCHHEAKILEYEATTGREWNPRPELRAKVARAAPPLRNMMRRTFGLVEPNHRPRSAFGDLVYVLNCHFPDLPCRYNPHVSPGRFSGPFLELVYEIVLQLVERNISRLARVQPKDIRVTTANGFTSVMTRNTTSST